MNTAIWADSFLQLGTVNDLAFQVLPGEHGGQFPGGDGFIFFNQSGAGSQGADEGFRFHILPQDAQTDSVGDTSVATDVLPFENMDFLFIPGIRTAITEGASQVIAYRIVGDQMIPFTLGIGEMTADERQIILDGCLINYYKSAQK